MFSTYIVNILCIPVEKSSLKFPLCISSFNQKLPTVPFRRCMRNSCELHTKCDSQRKREAKNDFSFTATFFQFCFCYRIWLLTKSLLFSTISADRSSSFFVTLVYKNRVFKVKAGKPMIWFSSLAAANKGWSAVTFWTNQRAPFGRGI